MHRHRRLTLSSTDGGIGGPRQWQHLFQVAKPLGDLLN